MTSPTLSVSRSRSIAMWVAKNKRTDRSRADALVGLSPGTSTATRTSSPAVSGSGSGFARGMALEPSVVLSADEPVSALDGLGQAQVITCCRICRTARHLADLIAHDLSVVRHISDRVAVMYLGRIVEIGTQERSHADPLETFSPRLSAYTGGRVRSLHARWRDGEPQRTGPRERPRRRRM